MALESEQGREGGVAMMRWHRRMALAVGMVALSLPGSVAGAGAAATPKLWLTIEVAVAMPHPGSHHNVSVNSLPGARCAVVVRYANGSTDGAASLRGIKTVGHAPASWLWTVPPMAARGLVTLGAGCWLGQQGVTSTRTLTLS